MLFSILPLSAFAKGPAAGAAIDAATAFKAYEAFNKVYLDTERNIYKNTDRDAAAIGRDRGAAAIWCQPMFVDMAIDAADLARRAGDKKKEKKYTKLVNDLMAGNIRHYAGFDFDDNDLDHGWFIYDDIQWWTITLLRAYMATGNESYRTLAEKSFARVWYGSPRVGDTGSYADPAKGLGGGMFWQWQPIDGPAPNRSGDGKMSCINFPTVVAAMLLYECAPADRKADPAPEVWTNDHGTFSRPAYETRDRYLEMAREIYDWSMQYLADPAKPGRIVDHSHNGNMNGGPLIYNQGTFIGASALLYLATGEDRYLRNAINGADYSINEMSAEHGMLPWAHNATNPYHQGSLEQGIYPAIWGQYMKILTDRCGQKQYSGFIVRNAAEGWENRDKRRDIADGESWKATSSDSMIGSYSASTVPSLMLLFAEP